MSKKRTRKQRQSTVFSLIMLPVLIIALLLFNNGITNIYLIGSLLIIGFVFASIAQSFVPDMRLKENKNKNKYTGPPKKRLLIKEVKQKAMVKLI